MPKTYLSGTGDADQQNKGDGFGKGGDAQGFHGVGLLRCEM